MIFLVRLANLLSWAAHAMKFFAKAIWGAMLLGFIQPGFGQSTDALINKLVQKGILTRPEADELRQESREEPVKPAMPRILFGDWAESLRLTGDLRVRFDDTFSENSAFVTRQRHRFRLRAGAILTLKDDLEFGFRLTSGPDGSPLASNQTFEDNASKKNIRIDQAYGRWSPSLGDQAALTLTLGKMESPFVFTELVLDTDYMPEGFAQQLSYSFSKNHSAKLILGEFVLDELQYSRRDPFLFGAQLRLDSQWNKRLQTSFGLAGLTIQNVGSLVTTNVPDVNSGNARNDAGSLNHHFNPLIADVSVTYWLDSFPGCAGAFPITLFSQFLWNPAARSANVAWAAGPTFGRAAKKGSWEISYRWKSLEGEAWYEELVSDDFGAFYQEASSRGPAGPRAGTNVRGHVMRVAYAVTDSFVLSVTYLGTELIEASPAGSKSGMHRVFVDALLKF
jgi:hypothetical protein